MLRHTPIFTRTATLVPYATLCRSWVLVLRMPDIIRLRTSMETTSAIYSKRNSLRPRDNNILLLRRSNADRAVDVWLHCAGDEFDNRNDDRIPEQIGRAHV